MTDRKNLKVKPATKDRLDELKREGQTTDRLLNLAFDTIEEREGSAGWQNVPVCTSCGKVSNVWTVEDGVLLCHQCADVEVTPDIE